MNIPSWKDVIQEDDGLAALACGRHAWIDTMSATDDKDAVG